MFSTIKKLEVLSAAVAVFLMAPVPFVFAIRPSKADVSIQDKFNGITPAQGERFDIAIKEWTPATATLPAHAFIVGCHGCAGANYDATGLLINSLDLEKIPTTWIMKVPENWDGRVVVIIPPGNLNQVQIFTVFSVAISALMNEGYAIGSMNHPSPGIPGFPYESFIKAPFHTHDYRNGYVGTGHLLRDLMSEVFGAPTGFYALGNSRGTIFGTGLLTDESNLFDGFVLGSGGNGYLSSIMEHIEAYLTVPNKVPLTGVPPMETTPAAKLDVFVGTVDGTSIGSADPEYIADVLDEGGVAEQLVKALAYNVADRPGEVQRAWADLELGTELKKPIIIFQGLRDRTAYPGNALTYAQRIVDAGKSDLSRLYLVRDMSHGGPFDPPAPPQSLNADAIRKLDAWVRNGTEPGPLNASQFGFRPSCAALGFGQDPLGCFCEVLDGGVGGLCSGDANSACMTDNPTTPANEDACVPAGKGICAAVIPDECGT